MALPYEDDPYIGETERAKRRKLAPRGTGTGAPGIEEGIGAPPVLGIPPQQAIAQAPRGGASRQFARQAAIALQPPPPPLPPPVAPLPPSSAPAPGYQPGQALAQNMQQSPAVAPTPAPPAPVPAPPPATARAAGMPNALVQLGQALNAGAAPPEFAPGYPPAPPVVGTQPHTPPGGYYMGPMVMPQAPAGAGYVPPVQQQQINPFRGVAEDAQRGWAEGGRVAAAQAAAEAAPQQLAQAPAAPNPHPLAQIVPGAIDLAPKLVPSVGIGGTHPLATSVSWPGFNTPAAAAAPPPAAAPTVPPKPMSPPNPNAPGVGTANTNWNQRATENVADNKPMSVPIPNPVGGSSVPAADRTPYPGAPLAAPTPPSTAISKLQDQSLASLGAQQTTDPNAPFHTEYVRMMAEKRGKDAAQQQFFNDEAERNRRIALAPSYREIELAKGEETYANMRGINRAGAKANREGLERQLSEASMPTSKRDFQAEEIARGVAADTRAGITQAQTQAEKMNPLAVAKGLQDIATGQQGISTARTAEEGARQKQAAEELHYSMQRELANPKTTEKRRQEIMQFLHSASNRDLFGTQALGGGFDPNTGLQLPQTGIIYDKTTGKYTYVGPEHGGAAGKPPQAAIEMLQKNPALREQFEAKYGKGSAGQYVK